MLWRKLLVIVLFVAAVICGCYDFHLHLHNATHDEVIDATVLTLLFGVLALVLGVVDSRLRRR